MDFKDLKRLAVECDGWIRTACLLVQDVMGEGFVFEDLSAGVKKKGSQEGVPSETKTTAVEVGQRLHQILNSVLPCNNSELDANEMPAL